MRNMKKNKRHSQKIYKMRGCSRKSCNHNHSKKQYSGFGGKGVVLGGDFANIAFPYTGPIRPNPDLAITKQQLTNYNGKGGYKCSPGTITEIQPKLGIVTTSNVNGVNPLYPNTGPPFNGFNFLNPITNQRGGNCNCGINGLSMNGGKNKKSHDLGCMCQVCSGKHRSGCRCSSCKIKKGQMSGGGGCSTSNNGIPYPDGLVGKPYLNPTNLPGANYIPGDANYYKNNTYSPVDISRQMLDIGANKPFLGFSHKGGRKKGYTKKRKGGGFSNFLGQDVVNLGRQIGFGVGSAYNALYGYPAPTNPLPWVGQLPNTANLNTIKHL
jgi:hypothetical protein